MLREIQKCGGVGQAITFASKFISVIGFFEGEEPATKKTQILGSKNLSREGVSAMLVVTTALHPGIEKASSCPS